MVESVTYIEALDVLKIIYEQEKLQLTTLISTLKITINQQALEIDKLVGREVMICERHFLMNYVKSDTNQDAAVEVGNTYTIVPEKVGVSSPCIDCAYDVEHKPEPYPYTHPVRTIYGNGLNGLLKQNVNIEEV